MKRKSNLHCRMPARWVSAIINFGENLPMTEKQMDKDTTMVDWTLEEASRSILFVLIDHSVSNHTGKSQLVLELPHLVNNKGPGYKLFAAVKEELRFGTSSQRPWLYDGWSHWASRTYWLPVRNTLPAFNPTMKVSIAPTWHQNNSVMYTGTHDNNMFLDGTAMKWRSNPVSTLACYTNRKETWIRPTCYASNRLCFCQLHGDFYDAICWVDVVQLDETSHQLLVVTGHGGWQRINWTPAVELRIAWFHNHLSSNKDFERS